MRKLTLAIVVWLTLSGSYAMASNSEDLNVGMVEKALTCEDSVKMRDVIKALKKMKARTSKESGDYQLLQPVFLFGLPVSHISITPGYGEGPDQYIAILPKTSTADVATAARLTPLAGSFKRDTSHGRLSADVRDHEDTWLTCTPN